MEGPALKGVDRVGGVGSAVPPEQPNEQRGALARGRVLAINHY